MLEPEIPDWGQQLVEDVVQNAGGDADFDFNALFEDLAVFRENPISINKASETDLREHGHPQRHPNLQFLLHSLIIRVLSHWEV